MAIMTRTGHSHFGQQSAGYKGLSYPLTDPCEFDILAYAPSSLRSDAVLLSIKTT
jgi:hypothetical protein